MTRSLQLLSGGLIKGLQGVYYSFSVLSRGLLGRTEEGVLANILNAALELMASQIDSMSVAGGFNNDWDNPNEFDGARKSFPGAEVWFIEETNEDEEDGEDSGLYTNSVLVEVRIVAAHETEQAQPHQAIQVKLLEALDDLKRLWGGANPLGAAGVSCILYRGARRVHLADHFHPSQIITRWLIKYNQDRDTPSQTGA